MEEGEEKKNQEAKREARKREREREREREHEGVRASFFAAVDQSSHFLHFGVLFFGLHQPSVLLCIFWLLFILDFNCIFFKMGLSLWKPTRKQHNMIEANGLLRS